jgi:hypothetical protein
MQWPVLPLVRHEPSRQPGPRATNRAVPNTVQPLLDGQRPRPAKRQGHQAAEIKEVGLVAGWAKLSSGAGNTQHHYGGNPGDSTRLTSVDM